MKKGKNIQSNSSQKESVQAGDSGSGLAIGLSLGVLIRIIIDNIGLGMIHTPYTRTFRVFGPLFFWISSSPPIGFPEAGTALSFPQSLIASIFSGLV